VEAPAPEVSPFFDESTILIAGSILLTVIVGGAFILIYKALDALKVSVPQQTISDVSTQMIKIIQNVMDGAKAKVEASPTPVDDALYNVGKIGTDFLIEEIKRRALTSEHQSKLIALGQGYGKTEIGGIG
jgi:hypothetical protein